MITYSASETSAWLLFARPGRVLLTSPELSDADALDLWTALAATDPVQEVLDRLTRRGLTSTPAFAMAHWSEESADTVQLLVRGDLTITVSTASDSSVIDAVGVSTWRELSVTATTGFVIESTGSQGGAVLPLDAGVVRASAVTVELAAASAPSAVLTAPVSTPVSTPVPAAPVVEAAPITSVLATPAVETAAPETTALENAAVAPSAVNEQTMVEPPPPADERNDAIPEETYSHLFEETIVRSIEEAAVRPEEEADPDDAASATADDDSEGDHDGLTMMSGDIAELRARRSGGAVDAPSVPASRALVLERDNGSVEALAQPVLVGRSPSVSKVSSGQIPRLVAIAGNPDISRNHAQFALEGDTVVVTDLHSRNGTTIVLPGKSPQLLRQGEPTAVIVGTLVDLGGGITFTVREQA